MHHVCAAGGDAGARIHGRDEGAQAGVAGAKGAGDSQVAGGDDEGSEVGGLDADAKLQVAEHVQGIAALDRRTRGVESAGRAGIVAARNRLLHRRERCPLLLADLEIEFVPAPANGSRTTCPGLTSATAKQRSTSSAGKTAGW